MNDDVLPPTNGLRVTRSVVVPEHELEWRFTASGGPGGQHANTSNTRAEVTLNIAESTAFGPVQRARLLERLGTEVRAFSSDERSQTRNRQLALERLKAKLIEGLHVETPRRPTKRTKGSHERRLQTKSKRSQTKALRRDRHDD